MSTEVTFGYFPILETERLRLRQLEPRDAETLYGYFSDEEALRPVLEYGFAQLQVNRIEGLIDPRNESSRKVLERLGFQYEGVLRQYLVMRGVPTDTAIFSLLRGELVL